MSGVDVVSLVGVEAAWKLVSAIQLEVFNHLVGKPTS